MINLYNKKLKNKDSDYDRIGMNEESLKQTNISTKNENKEGNCVILFTQSQEQVNSIFQEIVSKSHSGEQTSLSKRKQVTPFPERNDLKLLKLPEANLKEILYIDNNHTNPEKKQLDQIYPEKESDK